MAITLRSDITGTFGAIALNGVDRIKVDTSGVVTFTGSTVYSGGLDGTPIGSTTRSTGAFTGLTNAALTSGRVTYAGTGGLLQDSANLTFNGTTLTSTGFAGPISGVVTSTSITDSGLTSGRVTYAGTGGLLQDSAYLTFNGTTVTMANDASISGLTVGKGGGAVASNTAFGKNAFSVNTTGYQNTAVGFEAGYSNTTGLLNTYLGAAAGYSNSTSNAIVGIGAYALQNNTAAYNTAVGYNVMNVNTTGTSNTAFGTGDASTFSTMRYNTTGSYNSAFGIGALANNTTASNNTAVGYQAGYSNTTGANNICVGYQAGYNNTTGANNMAMGLNTLQANTTGSNNSAFGFQSLAFNTTASNNTAVGYQAGYSNNATGNIFIGYLAGSAGAGNYNVVIGNQTALNSTSDSYSILISGNTSAVGKGGSTGFIQPGGGGVYQGNNSSTWSTTSDRRLKKNIVDNTQGLAKISAIKVRNFEYRLPEEITEVSSDQAIQKTGIQLGAIAQELQQILPECVKQESTGIYTVDADPLIWYLINAVKELNAKLEAQALEIATLKGK